MVVGRNGQLQININIIGAITKNIKHLMHFHFYISLKSTSWNNDLWFCRIHNINSNFFWDVFVCKKNRAFVPWTTLTKVFLDIFFSGLELTDSEKNIVLLSQNSNVTDNKNHWGTRINFRLVACWICLIYEKGSIPAITNKKYQFFSHIVQFLFWPINHFP